MKLKRTVEIGYLGKNCKKIMNNLNNLEIKFIFCPELREIKEIVDVYEQTNWIRIKEKEDRAYYMNLVSQMVTGSFLFTVAVLDGKIVGTGRAISDKASDAYIQDVVIMENFRNQGIGAQIIKSLIDKLKEKKIKWIALIARENSNKFYEKLGFHEIRNTTPMQYYISTEDKKY